MSYPPIPNQPLQPSLPPPLLPLPSTSLLPQLNYPNSLFLKKNLRVYYEEMCYDMSSSINGDNELLKEIPKQYNSIRLLDNDSLCVSTGSFGYISKVFKVFIYLFYYYYLLLFIFIVLI